MAKRRYNPEACKQWYNKNKDRVKEQHCRNRDKIREYARQYVKDNPEKVRKRQKQYRLKALYGISIEDYNAMFTEQGGRCAICHKHQSELNRSLVVDHNHGNGQVRQLLCDKCNVGLGCFDDNNKLLQGAIDYLGQFNNN